MASIQQPIASFASDADQDGFITSVYYNPIENEPTEATKLVIRERVITRTEEQLSNIDARKNIPRFGSAKGSTGPERGITMTSPDEFLIEDPTSVEAQQTGEEKLIERLKSSTKHRKTRTTGSGYDSPASNRSPARTRTPNRKGNKSGMGYQYLGQSGGGEKGQWRSKTPPAGKSRSQTPQANA